MNTAIWTIILIFFFFVVGLVIWAVVNRIREKYLQSDPILFVLKDKVRPMFKLENYTGNLEPLNRYGNLIDNVEIYKGVKSYTINKSKIFLCVTDEEGKYYDENMLVYVFLHEIAHVICDEVGHTDKFAAIFQDLLDIAVLMGIYNPSIPILQNYCNYN